MKYRPDIDGLRAIAVAAVVLYHTGATPFAGGYLGVDIFFVLSGYLITQLLVGRRAAPMDLWTFYERRIRRIAPALVLVLLTCIGAGLIWFSPKELIELSRTLLWTLAFGSNYYFGRKVGYFEAGAATNPLLHMWSLSVEEQFYLFYPALVRVLQRAVGSYLVLSLALLCAASFALDQWFAIFHPRFAFYFPLARAWEFLVGALVAVVPIRASFKAPLANAMSGGALAGLVLPLFVSVPSTSSFGVFFSAVPCLSAAALIQLHAQYDTTVRRILSTPPLVQLGLISYSLYLWHWPLFVFFGRATLQDVSLAEYGGLIAAAVALAFVSWRYVEQPFRNPRGLERRQVFLVMGISFAGIAALGVAAVVTAGLPIRFSPAAQRAYAYLDGGTAPTLTAPFNADGCVATDDGRFPFEKCFRVSSTKPNIVLWGDSHARNYLVGLRDRARVENFNLIRVTYSACVPAVYDSNATPDCAAFNRSVFSRLDRHITAVIMAAQLFTKPDSMGPMQRTAALLVHERIRVIVVGAALAYKQAVPLYVARSVTTEDPALLDSRGKMRASFAETEARVRRAFATLPGVTFVSVYRTVCHNGRCPMTIGAGIPMQFDEAHTTAEGSRFLGGAIWPQVLRGVHAALPSSDH